MGVNAPPFPWASASDAPSLTFSHPPYTHPIYPESPRLP